MFYISAEHAQAVAGSGYPKKGPADVVSLVGSSNTSNSLKDKEVAAHLERMRKEMEAMKIIMEKQVRNHPGAKGGQNTPAATKGRFGAGGRAGVGSKRG